MKKIILISEECHGTIGAASTFEKAKQFLLESGWVDEGFEYDYGVPIKETFGENWQEEFMKLKEEDFEGQFYFDEEDFLE
jgi:hypothetical protein